MSAVTTKESKELLKSNGWDQGLVFFGFAASENSVRLLTMLEYLKAKGKIADYRKVVVSFDKAALKGDSMGKDSPEWYSLTDNLGYMPGLAIDGILYMEAGGIIKMLNAKFPTVTGAEGREVTMWLDYVNGQVDTLFAALKHWGWAPMHGEHKNYKDFGFGKRDLAWEKQTVAGVDAFFKKLDAALVGKDFFVGSALTPADCTLINWATSFHLILGLNVAKRYPNVWRYSTLMKAARPAGSQDFFKVFPMFGGVIGMLNTTNRGCACWKGREFHIDNPQYWS